MPTEPYEICDRVWFGPAAATYETPARFTHIVNCEATIDATAQAALIHVGPSRFLFLKSYDDPSFAILDQHLAILTAFVTNALTNPTAQVYIHCFMGLNRSAALAVAYACQTTQQSAASLIPAVRMGSRRLILTNDGFERQLVARFP